MDDLEELEADPRFQNLLGKAETHEWEFRPQEAERLQAEGKLQSLLVQRTKACWDELRAGRRSGMTQWEVQEVALPLILVPEENKYPPTPTSKLMDEYLGSPEGPEPKNSEEWIRQGIQRLQNPDGKALF